MACGGALGSVKIKRHWTCKSCCESLARVGHTTLLGSLTQAGLPVKGWTGPIRLSGQEYLPPPGKWAKVSVPHGAIQVRRGGKWRNWRTTDLGQPSQEVTPPNRLALAGVGVSGYIPAVPRISEFNALKVLAGRVFRVPKNIPKAEVYSMAAAAVRVLMPGFVDPIERMSDVEWLESMPVRRRQALMRAMTKTKTRHWDRKWEKFSAFIKTEKLPGFAKNADSTGAVPLSEAGCIERLIQGPHDATHCIAGPWLKPCIGRLKRVWDKDSPIFYGSRSRDAIDEWYNADASWLYGALVVACDYSMFDNCHNPLSWAFMEALYKQCGLMADPRFRRVMEVWRKPAGTLTGKGWGVKYSANVMNASGRDDTALANGVLNGFAMYCALAAALLQVPILSLTPALLQSTFGRIKLSVTGDDSLAFVKGVSDVEAFSSAVADGVAAFGFEAKLLTCPRTFDTVYLGMRPYPVAGRWYFGRTIGRAVFKYGWKSAPLTDDLGAWFAGECVATLQVEAHVPVLVDIARAYLRWWGVRPKTKVQPDHNRPWTIGTPTPEYDETTLRYVAHGYSVPVSALKDLLAQVENLRSFPCLLAHPVLERMVLFDDL